MDLAFGQISGQGGARARWCQAFDLLFSPSGSTSRSAIFHSEEFLRSWVVPGLRCSLSRCALLAFLRCSLSRCARWCEVVPGLRSSLCPPTLPRGRERRGGTHWASVSTPGCVVGWVGRLRPSWTKRRFFLGGARPSIFALIRERTGAFDGGVLRGSNARGEWCQAFDFRF